MDQIIVDLIENFKAYYAVYGVMMWEHNRPEVQRVVANDLADPTANIGAFRNDGSRYELYLQPIMARAQTPAFNLFYLRMSMIMAIATVADELQRLNRIDASPEIQFFRHLRNACAHGNRFHLKKGEPKRPAKFRSLEVLSKHHGVGPVLFDFIMPGDVLDLLDYIATLP